MASALHRVNGFDPMLLMHLWHKLMHFKKVSSIQIDCVQVMYTMKNGEFSAIASAAIYNDCNIPPIYI
jgi:hypothetical protein